MKLNFPKNRTLNQKIFQMMLMVHSFGTEINATKKMISKQLRVTVKAEDYELLKHVCDKLEIVDDLKKIKFYVAEKSKLDLMVESVESESNLICQITLHVDTTDTWFRISRNIDI